MKFLLLILLALILGQENYEYYEDYEIEKDNNLPLVTPIKRKRGKIHFSL